jgi:hypothetical protein
MTTQLSICAGARVLATIAGVLLGLLPARSHGQITPQDITQIGSVVGSRIEAMTILGADYGITGGTFRSTGSFQSAGRTSAQLSVSKLGGAGDIGTIEPLGDLPIGWQPELQGNVGHVEATNDLHSTLLQGDVSTETGVGAEFGGGAAFYLSDGFSLTPTVMALYGSTVNTYTANSTFMKTYLGLATQLGLVDYTVNTLIFRPALEIQYKFTWDRTIFTMSSIPTYFHTVNYTTHNASAVTHGNSSALIDTIDVDIPLGVELFGHELRTGGFADYTNLSGGLRTGLNTTAIAEVNYRVVMDLLDQFWRVRWVGLGVSYIWGQQISGWTAGLDVTFKF